VTRDENSQEKNAPCLYHREIRPATLWNAAPITYEVGSPSGQSPGDRLRHVDGLRAIAVLGVVCSHAAKYTLDYHQGGPFHALYEGAHGVDLFFVISGFCLSLPVIAKARATGRATFDVARFFAHRIIRIFPPYWIAFAALLVVALAVRRFGGTLPWPTVEIPVSISDGVRQLAFTNTGAPLCGSFWTLAVEFRWYLAFPILLWLYMRSPLYAVAAGAAAFALYHFTPLQPWDFATLPAFLMGIAAADLSVAPKFGGGVALVLFAASLAGALFFEPKGHLDYALQNQLGWQLPCFFFVVAAGSVSWLRRLLSMRPFVLIGTASYSIYLVHDPVEAWYGLYGGQGWIVAAIAGTLAGIAFWMIAERFFTVRATRDALTERFNRFIEPLARAVHLPTAVAMSKAS
jgi:peptidoglycan/LPS O-acetylase OafA/YrhL